MESRNFLWLRVTRMSHGVKRQRESPEKEVARLEKERAEISDYRALTEEVMARVFPSPIIPSISACEERHVKICIRLDDHSLEEEP